MGFYKNRETFVEGLAEADPMVQHNQPVTVGSSELRQSFFRINDEEELLAACVNWIHLPCVAMYGLSGAMANKDGSKRQRNFNTWWFLTNLVLDENNPVEADAITNAYDTTFTVMMNFIKAVNDEYEENGGCGEFMYLDLNNIKWSQEGPIGNGLYGWILTFFDETKTAL